jgi:hypothetical protein
LFAWLHVDTSNIILISVVDDPVNSIDNLLHMGSHAFALCSYEKLFTSKYFDVIYLIISIFGLVVTREKSVS